MLNHSLLKIGCRFVLRLDLFPSLYKCQLIACEYCGVPQQSFLYKLTLPMAGYPKIQNPKLVVLSTSGIKATCSLKKGVNSCRLGYM